MPVIIIQLKLGSARRLDSRCLELFPLVGRLHTIKPNTLVVSLRRQLDADTFTHFMSHGLATCLY